MLRTDLDTWNSRGIT